MSRVPGGLSGCELILVRYLATNIDQIAERAGVSKPTVFASVGSKRASLKEVRDIGVAGDDLPVPVRERPWYREAIEETDPRQSLRLHARNMVRMHQRYADIHDILRAGAGADPELRRLWNTSERERRVGSGFIVESLHQRIGPLCSNQRPSAPFVDQHRQCFNRRHTLNV